MQILCLKATVDANKQLNNGAVYFWATPVFKIKEESKQSCRRDDKKWNIMKLS